MAAPSPTSSATGGCDRVMTLVWPNFCGSALARRARTDSDWAFFQMPSETSLGSVKLLVMMALLVLISC